MSDVFKITVERDNDKIELTYSDEINIIDLVDNFELVMLFLGYNKISIDNAFIDKGIELKEINKK